MLIYNALTAIFTSDCGCSPQLSTGKNSVPMTSLMTSLTHIANELDSLLRTAEHPGLPAGDQRRAGRDPERHRQGCCCRRPAGAHDQKRARRRRQPADRAPRTLLGRPAAAARTVLSSRSRNAHIRHGTLLLPPASRRASGCRQQRTARPRARSHANGWIRALSDHRHRCARRCRRCNERADCASRHGGATMGRNASELRRRIRLA